MCYEGIFKVDNGPAIAGIDRVIESGEITNGTSDGRELGKVGDDPETLAGGIRDVIVIYSKPVVRKRMITEDLIIAVLC